MSKVIKILISACLLGEPVRYNGTGKRSSSEILGNWQKEGWVISVCPEVAGGLPVPRNPAEIVDGDGADVLQGKTAVVDDRGTVVSAYFIGGANKALEMAQKYQVVLAVLKEGSPSCGSGYIYNGAFDGTRLPRMGVTARLLTQHGIPVFSEHQFTEADQYLQSLKKHGK